MGENKHIKELDAFAKKYVKEISTEQPSLDFTASLMKKITLGNLLKNGVGVVRGLKSVINR